MHLRNIEFFCDVVAFRSFSKAADSHHVSQSTVSQAIHLIEKKLNTKLIDRSKRPMELTKAGEIYFKGCKETLANYKLTESRVRECEGALSGDIRVTAIYSAGLLKMETTAKSLEDQYPLTSVQINYLHPDEVYDSIKKDEADFGIVSFPREGGDYRSIPWQEQEMILAIHPDHRLAGYSGPLPLTELNQERFIAFTPELPIRKRTDRWLKDAKVQVNIAHEFDNVENIKRDVEIGAGIAIIPLPTVRKELETGSIRILHFDSQNLIRPLGIVCKRHKKLSQAAEKFVELLRGPPKAND
jgi:DNA-binding transcriptional LysR family regulator